jgi:hypothetical protein
LTLSTNLPRLDLTTMCNTLAGSSALLVLAGAEGKALDS